MANTIFSCMKCGTCSASCPSGRVVAFKTRKLVEDRCLGNIDYDNLEIWYCTTCYNCMERCPRDIDITEEILKIREEAFACGKALPAHSSVMDYIRKTGHAVPINDAAREKRKSLGLSELPPTTHSFEDALEEVRALARPRGECRE